MNTLDCPKMTMRATQVRINDRQLTVDLIDGRTLSVPLEWYPRLAHGTPEERNDYRLIANGVGIHWPSVDEDISIQNLIDGRRSAESAASISQWLANREQQKVAV